MQKEEFNETDTISLSIIIPPKNKLKNPNTKDRKYSRYINFKDKIKIMRSNFKGVKFEYPPIKSDTKITQLPNNTALYFYYNSDNYESYTNFCNIFKDLENKPIFIISYGKRSKEITIEVIDFNCFESVNGELFFSIEGFTTIME